MAIYIEIYWNIVEYIRELQNSVKKAKIAVEDAFQ